MPLILLTNGFNGFNAAGFLPLIFVCLLIVFYLFIYNCHGDIFSYGTPYGRASLGKSSFYLYLFAFVMVYGATYSFCYVVLLIFYCRGKPGLPIRLLARAAPYQYLVCPCRRGLSADFSPESIRPTTNGERHFCCSHFS